MQQSRGNQKGVRCRYLTTTATAGAGVTREARCIHNRTQSSSSGLQRLEKSKQRRKLHTRTQLQRCNPDSASQPTVLYIHMQRPTQVPRSGCETHTYTELLAWVFAVKDSPWHPWLFKPNPGAPHHTARRRCRGCGCG